MIVGYPLIKHIVQLRRLMESNQFNCLFQPIVSLSSGAVTGWEALLRGPENHEFHRPDRIFEIAEATRHLFELEIISHRTAIAQVEGLSTDQKLFLNVHSHVILDERYDAEKLVGYLAMHKMMPRNIVLEITERQHVEDYRPFVRKIDMMRKRGFLIAVDDVGSGYSGLQAIAEIRPDYLKVDMSLIRNIHHDRVKQAMMEMFITFSEKIGSGIVAEGIESEQELYALMKMNIHFGQGFFFGRPALKKEIPDNDILCRFNRLLNRDGIKMLRQAYPIGDLAENAVSVDHKTTVKAVKEIFDAHPAVSGIVVMESDYPAGLVMRQHLDAHLGKKYGVSLYYDRDIASLMDRSALMVDEKAAIEAVSQTAMNRGKMNLYDHIIVTSGDRLRGLVSVSSLLEMMTRIRVEMARGANPLTGLPGNLAIENELRRRENEGESYGLVFVDLDHFKSLNDRYGFETGDSVILHTANLLRSVLKKFVPDRHFLGHIGGDDFVFILPEGSVEQICRKIIRYFDYLILRFYDSGDLNEGRIWCRDRDGLEKWMPVVSISMAVVDIHENSGQDLKAISTRVAQLKKYAKSLPGSVYVRDRREAEGSAPASETLEHESNAQATGHVSAGGHELRYPENPSWSAAGGE